METRQVLRPLGGCLLTHATSLSSSSLSASVSVSVAAAAARRFSPTFRSVAAAQAVGNSRRHQSTTSRTKKRLKIPPHPDFLTPLSGQNHIIFNPPAAAPSVYHTPFKFLPKSDPRRQANLSQLVRGAASSNPSSSSSSNTPLPPLSRTQTETHVKKYNVTREQVEEMRKLRSTDPATWSVLKLARKFDCSPYFVIMCCRATPEHQENERQRLEAIKARWGTIRTKARQERAKRKTLLLQGAL